MIDGEVCRVGKAHQERAHRQAAVSTCRHLPRHGLSRDDRGVQPLAGWRALEPRALEQPCRPAAKPLSGGASRRRSRRSQRLARAPAANWRKASRGEANCSWISSKRTMCSSLRSSAAWSLLRARARAGTAVRQRAVTVAIEGLPDATELPWRRGGRCRCASARSDIACTRRIAVELLKHGAKRQRLLAQQRAKPLERAASPSRSSAPSAPFVSSRSDLNVAKSTKPLSAHGSDFHICRSSSARVPGRRRRAGPRQSASLMKLLAALAEAVERRAEVDLASLELEARCASARFAADDHRWTKRPTPDRPHRWRRRCRGRWRRRAGPTAPRCD